MVGRALTPTGTRTDAPVWLVHRTGPAGPVCCRVREPQRVSPLRAAEEGASCAPAGASLGGGANDPEQNG